MKTELVEVILLHVLMFSARIMATDEYNISESKTTWTVASNSCKLATPRVSYLSESFYVSDDIPGGNTASMWVGYVSLYHKFEYIGCVSNSTLNVIIPITVYSHPGRCFAACGGGKFFGLYYRSCYCFNSTQPVLDNRDKCFHYGCGGEASARCGGWEGGSDGEPVVAVYQEVGMSTSDDGMSISKKFCRSYDPRNSKVQWESCLTRYSPLCNDTGAIALNNVTEHWNTAVSECFNEDMYPLYNITTPLTVTGQTSLGKNLWTAMFRSPVIHAASGDQYAETPGIKYGYIRHDDSDEKKNDGGKYVLDFEDSTSEQRHFLCNVDANTDKQTSTDADTDEQTSTDSYGTTSNTEMHNEPNRNHGSTPAPSQVGTYVGIAVGVTVALLIIGVVIIVFTRRRKRKLNEDTISKTTANYDTRKDKQITNNAVRVSDIHENTTNHPSISGSENDYALTSHDDSYAIIPSDNKKLAKDKNGKQERKQTPGNKDDNVLQYGSANVGKTNQIKADPKPDQTSDKVYAKACKGKRIPPVSSSQASEQKSQHPQKTQNPALTGNPMSTDDNNVYDISGEYPHKTVQSDNVYNTAQFRGTDGDDTYDHTMGTNGDRLHADDQSWNVYNTANVKANRGDDPTYDSTLQANVKANRGGDPTYDSTLQANVKANRGGDPTYDSTLQANIKANRGDDPTYDSTLQAPNKQQTVDPLYSHATLKQ